MKIRFSILLHIENINITPTCNHGKSILQYVERGIKCAFFCMFYIWKYNTWSSSPKAHSVSRQTKSSIYQVDFVSFLGLMMSLVSK